MPTALQPPQQASPSGAAGTRARWWAPQATVFLAIICSSLGLTVWSESGWASEPPPTPTVVQWSADIWLRGGNLYDRTGQTPGDQVFGATTDDRAGGWQRSRAAVSLRRDWLAANLQLQAQGSSGTLPAMQLGMQQAYVQAERGRALKFKVQMGRQPIQVASGLLIGTYEASDRGRVFDAVTAQLAHGGHLRLRAFAGRAQPVQTDETIRRLAGFTLEATPDKHLHVDVFLLGHGDEVGSQSWRMLTMGAGLQWQMPGRLLLAAEGALQVGDVRTKGQKTGDDQLAGMGRMQLSWRSRAIQPVLLRLSGSVWSGDDETADNVRRSFKPLFGDLDAAVGWLRLWQPSGLRQVVVDGSLPLAPNLSASAEWRASWAAGLHAAPWWKPEESVRFAGHEPVLRLQWQILQGSTLSWTAGAWWRDLGHRPVVIQSWLSWNSLF